MITRRRVLALTGAALLGQPATALAGQPAADRTADALVALVGREQDASAAYRAAGGRLLGRLADNCDAHVRALESQLESVGREPPAPPEGGEPASRGRAVELERAMIGAYRRLLGDLYDPATKRTAATIMAGHAQHLVALQRDPLHALGELS